MERLWGWATKETVLSPYPLSPATPVNPEAQRDHGHSPESEGKGKRVPGVNGVAASEAKGFPSFSSSRDCGVLLNLSWR